jgi:hypothetical protein
VHDYLPEWQDGYATDCKSAYADHEFITHDQRAGDACELEFDDLDARERAIFLRCGFRAPQAA